MDRTLVIVPLYNEEMRFKKEAFFKFIKNHHDVSFLFVNDGSTDNTLKLLEEVCAENSATFSYIHLPENRGKANAVRSGFAHGFEGDFKYIGYWDADLATPLSSIISFVKVLENNPGLQLVMGARVNLLGRSIRRKLSRHYIGRIFATIVSNLLHLQVYDTQCGAKLFRNSAHLVDIMTKPFVSRWVFDVEIIKRMAEGGLEPSQSIYEYPLESWEDVDGSKLRTGDFFRILGDLWKIFR